MHPPESALTVRDQREPGWFFVDNEILDDHGKALGAYGIAVYCALCRYAKHATQQVELSQRDIAKSLGISQDRVRKSLGDLMRLGLIHMSVPEQPGPGLISTITLRKVKRTERHAFSSAAELNAIRSRNKEEKNKTKQYPPNPPAGGLTPRQLKDLSKEMNRIAQASVGNSITDEEILRAACFRLVLPYDLAKEAIARSCGETIQ